MLRNDEELFLKFGQVYCTTINHGVVKGWHYHKKQIDNFVCVNGMMKLVAYDSRPGSPPQGLVNEFFIGTHNPLLVQIPPRVYHGFKGLSEPEATVINISTEPYRHGRPDEYRPGPTTHKKNSHMIGAAVMANRMMGRVFIWRVAQRQDPPKRDSTE